MYKNLIEDGWTLHQIDEMDVHFYFELLENDEQEDVLTYAEDVPWL